MRKIIGFLLVAVAVILAATGAIPEPASNVFGLIGFVGFGLFYEDLKSFIGDCRTNKIVSPSGGVTSGDWFLHNGRVVKAMTTKAVGLPLMVLEETTDAGVDVPKAAVTVVSGEEAFWDDGASNFTNVAAGNDFAGLWVEDTASGIATGRIHLLIKQPTDVP